MIRSVILERDEDTQAKSLVDIREFREPVVPTPRTWSELAKVQDPARRTLIMELMRQVDDLVSGVVDEISLIRSDR